MLVIEYPLVNSQETRDEYAVYEYGTYEKSSVLAGQEKRSFRDSFPTLAEAQANYPTAEWWAGSGYREIVIPHEPPEWFDPANAGETWVDDY